MIKSINKLIETLYLLLFFLIPIVLFTQTSELFEFNKMILTYILTCAITSLWLIRMVLEKRLIFKQTILDTPLLIFLSSQIISTIVSIDPRTSILGYYSRFHGGLVSTFCYLLLYWAYVSNLKSESIIKSLYTILISAFLVSTYGVLQHFGIDKHIWVQDVQTRIFSTLGQPNWLAAWIVAVMPITWAFAIDFDFNEKSPKLNSKNFILMFFLSSLFFITLLFTKSRSGILGLALANAIFWFGVLLFFLKWINAKNYLFKIFILLNLTFAILILVIGTPWTPNLKALLKKNQSQTLIQKQTQVAPALEIGGSETSQIRKIVWRGAIDIWKNYPLFGSGVETFAFSYYKFKPVEHNLTSEWDFLYNKAHNEYLNYAATTGAVGLTAYLVLISFQTFVFSKNLKSKNLYFNNKAKNIKFTFTKFLHLSPNFGFPILNLALLSGFTSILVTNFFGFSVVPVAILFFLYPAIAIITNPILQTKPAPKIGQSNLNLLQKILILTILSSAIYLFILISRYWYSDYLYAQGKMQADAKNLSQAQDYLTKAIKLSPKEPLFREELSQLSADIAIFAYSQDDLELAKKYAQKSQDEIFLAINLSPANVNLKRTLAQNYIKLSQIDPGYLEFAKEVLEKALLQAPTDAKLIYNLGLVYARLGDLEKGIETLQKTIEMKRNYRNAYYALGQVYLELGNKELAKKQFEFILKNLNPNDVEAQRALDEL